MKKLIDIECEQFIKSLRSVIKDQVVKDQKVYTAKGKAFRKMADKHIWDKVKNRKLLAYWLLEFYNNHLRRTFEPMTKSEIPADLDEGLKDEINFMHDNIGWTYEDAVNAFKHETGAEAVSMCDVFLDILREDSKYWHICDEELHLDCFLKLSGEKKEKIVILPPKSTK